MRGQEIEGGHDVGSLNGKQMTALGKTPLEGPKRMEIGRIAVNNPVKPVTPAAAAKPAQPAQPAVARMGNPAQKIGAVQKRAWANKPSGASDDPVPTKDEFERRKDRVRKLIGTIMGMGYGAFGGSMIGKELLNKPLAPSAAVGAGIGGLAGLGIGTAVGHLKRYTGETQHPPSVQIIIPSTHPEGTKERLEEALAKSAVARTLKHFVRK